MIFFSGVIQFPVAFQFIWCWSTCYRNHNFSGKWVEGQYVRVDYFPRFTYLPTKRPRISAIWTRLVVSGISIMPKPAKKVPRIINRRLPSLASRGIVKRPGKQQTIQSVDRSQRKVLRSCLRISLIPNVHFNDSAWPKLGNMLLVFKYASYLAGVYSAQDIARWDLRVCMVRVANMY